MLDCWKPLLPRLCKTRWALSDRGPRRLSSPLQDLEQLAEAKALNLSTLSRKAPSPLWRPAPEGPEPRTRGPYLWAFSFFLAHGSWAFVLRCGVRVGELPRELGKLGLLLGTQGPEPLQLGSGSGVLLRLWKLLVSGFMFIVFCIYTYFAHTFMFFFLAALLVKERT